MGTTIVSIDLSESALANDCDGQVHCTSTCLPRGWDARSGWWVAGPGGRGQFEAAPISIGCHFALTNRRR